MKGLGPENMAYNPYKNEGCGFPWHVNIYIPWVWLPPRNSGQQKFFLGIPYETCNPGGDCCHTRLYRL